MEQKFQIGEEVSFNEAPENVFIREVKEVKEGEYQCFYKIKAIDGTILEDWYPETKFSKLK